jgi:mono/diheme cytochrome c family protein
MILTMRTVLLLLAGAVLAIAVAAIIGIVFMKTSGRGFSARDQPTAIERYAARQARDMAMPAEARDTPNPVVNSPEVLAQARAHWADHCATCHANDGSGQTEMGPHMYPPAPDMRQRDTQRLTDGELFFIIENGVRLTGMPSWGGSHHGQEDSWKLVHFIRHLSALSKEEIRQMEKLNPKSPADLEEERQEEEFLRGPQAQQKEKSK